MSQKDKKEFDLFLAEMKKLSADQKSALLHYFMGSLGSCFEHGIVNKKWVKSCLDNSLDFAKKCPE